MPEKPVNAITAPPSLLECAAAAPATIHHDVWMQFMLACYSAIPGRTSGSTTGRGSWPVGGFACGRRRRGTACPWRRSSGGPAYRSSAASHPSDPPSMTPAYNHIPSGEW